MGGRGMTWHSRRSSVVVVCGSGSGSGDEEEKVGSCGQGLRLVRARKRRCDGMGEAEEIYWSGVGWLWTVDYRLVCGEIPGVI